MGSSSLLCLHGPSSSSHIAFLGLSSHELNEKDETITCITWKNSSTARSLKLDISTSNIIAPTFANFHPGPSVLP